jgi:hypothetical protein
MNAYIINEEDGISVFVDRMNDGRFSVRIFDVDAQMFVESMKIFDNEDSAKAYARKFA